MNPPQRRDTTPDSNQEPVTPKLRYPDVAKTGKGSLNTEWMTAAAIHPTPTLT